MKKNIFLLLVCLAGILFSCSEDDQSQSTEHHHQNVKKTKVSFQEMKIFFEQNATNYFPASLNVSANKNGDDYITKIDSTKITQIVNESVITFTLHVNTLDDELYAFSNLVIRFSNGQTEEYIYHYNPTNEWLEAYNSEEYLPYEGNLIVSNTSGQKTSGCGEALITIRIPCTGDSETCPCTDGNGQVFYITVTLDDCDNGISGGGGNSSGNGNGSSSNGGTGGGGSGSGNGGGSGGSGGTGGGTGGGNGPVGPGTGTDPDPGGGSNQQAELEGQLLDILDSNDEFYFGNDFAPVSPLQFNSVDDFEQFLNNSEETTKSFVSEQGNERIIKARIRRVGFLTGIDIFYKLSKNINNIYNLTDVNSNIWGVSLAYDWEQSYFTQTTNGNIINVVVYGYEIMGVQINGIDFTYRNYKEYTVQINKTTGSFVD